MPGADGSRDVAIIGAGPAGSAAAIALARAGRDVLLIDRRDFPRGKACGGCLSGRGVRQLEVLIGADASLDARAGVRATGIRFHIGRYALNSRADGRSRLVCRDRFDAWLVEQAKAMGAEVRTSTAAELERDAKGWCLRVEGKRLTARHIIVATGAGRLPRGLAVDQAAPASRRMAAQSWIQPAADGLPGPGGIEMYWLRGGYVGLAATTPGVCTIALAADMDTGGRGSPLERLRRANRACALWDRLEPPDAGETVEGAAGFPWRPRRVATDNLLLTGDAAGYEEPFTGEGIGLALISADCAAQAIITGGIVSTTYQQLMRLRHTPILRRTRLLGAFLRSPLILRLAEGPRFLPSHWLSRLIEHVHVEAT